MSDRRSTEERLFEFDVGVNPGLFFAPELDLFDVLPVGLQQWVQLLTEATDFFAHHLVVFVLSDIAGPPFGRSLRYHSLKPARM